MWRRTAPVEITTRLDEMYADLSRIISRLMSMDAKLNSLTAELLEDEDDGEQEEDDAE